MATLLLIDFFIMTSHSARGCRSASFLCVDDTEHPGDYFQNTGHDGETIGVGQPVMLNPDTGNTVIRIHVHFVPLHAEYDTGNQQ